MSKRPNETAVCIWCRRHAVVSPSLEGTPMPYYPSRYHSMTEVLFQIITNPGSTQISIPPASSTSVADRTTSSSSSSSSRSKPVTSSGINVAPPKSSILNIVISLPKGQKSLNTPIKSSQRAMCVRTSASFSSHLSNASLSASVRYLS